ncbi:MAG: YidC/Oxa1 family membrane protein insertase [Candidatus Bipolaricaulaceae bacterium]
MGRISLIVGLALAALAAAAAAAPQPLAIEQLTREDHQVIELTGSLVRYRFADRGGVLESAYIHFYSYRAAAVDAVPGWVAADSGLALAEGVSLPFEVWVGEDKRDQRDYTASVVRQSDDVAKVELANKTDTVSVDKSFVVDSNAYYTLDVEVRLAAAGEAVRLVLGHRPVGKGAPDLLFLYDGEVYTSPLAAGAYSRFEGLGLVDREVVYFLRLDEASGLVPFLGMNTAGQPVFGLEAQSLSGEATVRGTLYAGRNRYLLLDKAGLGELTDLNLFSRFLVMVMRFFGWLYRATGNYGWAIILFTLVTRVILYPLMRNQLRSMAKMQRLQPKVKKLQEKYKDDRETLQKQMLELYRKERVNPLGGCLPMLLQLPILILLWQAILYSAEQIHLSPGFLWIPDLSQPDPFYILVVLTTGAMLFQQWLTQRRMPEQATGGTQVVGWIFPIFLAILFMNFPAGLWLYYFLTTAFQMGQQLVIDWEMAREGAASRGGASREAPSDGSQDD